MKKFAQYTAGFVVGALCLAAAVTYDIYNEVRPRWGK